jgi:hypothetical protein
LYFNSVDIGRRINIDGVFMKRNVVFVILVFSAFGLIFAQSPNRNAQEDSQIGYRVTKNPTPQVTVYNVPGPAKRIISGVLGVSRGMVTLNDRKGVAWYVLGLDRFIGFIDGLDLGQEVELEGYAPAAPGSSQERFFQAVKLILDGLAYDLTPLPESDRTAIPPRINYESTALPEGSWATTQPRREPGPVQNHVSPWAPNNDRWMQNLDLNAIWNDDPTFWRYNGKAVRDSFFD